jgi:hypothetical protein
MEEDMRIKPNTRRTWFFATSYLLVIASFALFTGVVFLRETLANPILKITSITSSNVSLWITNGVSTNFYEVFGQNVLESSQISTTKTGVLGQTNFVIERVASEAKQFFKAAVNNDWDGDGILNVQDADPRNGSKSNVLTITIRTPTNGANLQ